MNLKSFLVAVVVFGTTTLGASAATLLSSGDFSIDGQTTSGNCPTADTPCILLANAGPNSTATLSIGGGAFDLSGFFYSLQGTGSQVTATSDLGGVFVNTNPQGSITGLFADLTGVSGFTGITSVQFTNTGNGTVRVGGFSGEAPIPAVPLPASGLLLLGALGLSLVSKRKKS